MRHGKKSIGIVVLMFLVIILNNITTVLASSYSVNLLNSELSVSFDPANILIENANSDNEYRNIFDCLKNITSSSLTYDTFRTNYKDLNASTILHQTYFDDLDNEFTFKSENSTLMYVNQTIENITMNEGNLSKEGNLEQLDLNLTRIESTNTFSHNSTYDFQDDIVGNTPLNWTDNSGGGCTANISEGLDNHHKIIELQDSSAVFIAQIYNEFTSQNSGTIEFWMRTTDNDGADYTIFKIFDGGTGGTQVIIIGFQPTAAGQIQYHDGIEGWNNAQAYTKDTWYHIRLDLDCATDIYDLYIDGNLIEANNNFANPVASFDTLQVHTRTDTAGYSGYIDAVGYSFYPYYEIGDNLIYHNATLNFTAEINDVDVSNLYQFSIDYSMNISNFVNVNVSIYNFNDNEYELINSTNESELYLNSHLITSNVLNYFDNDNNLRIKFTCFNQTTTYNLTIDYLKLILYNYSINDDGFHDLREYVKLINSTVILMECITQFKIYASYITINFTGNIYKNLGIYGNFSDFYTVEIPNTINVKSIEINIAYIQVQIEPFFSIITNAIDIYINNIFFHSNISYKLEMPYHSDLEIRGKMRYKCFNSYEREFQQTTTDFSMNNLKGIRSLYSEQAFIEKPSVSRFFEPLQLVEIILDDSDLDDYQPDDPEIPKGSNYWTFETWKIELDSNAELKAGNWTFEYPLIKGVVETNYYSYFVAEYEVSTENIFELLISYLIAVLVWILEKIVQAFQYILMWLTIALNITIVLLMCIIIGGFFWNFVIKFLVWSILSLMWLIYYGGIWLWTYGLKYLIIFLASIIAFLITLLFWLFTFCTADFYALYDLIYAGMLEASSFMMEIIVIVIDNLIVFLYFLEIYILLLLLILYKHYVSKAKGNTNRALALKQAFDFFAKPIKALLKLVLSFKNLITKWF